MDPKKGEGPSAENALKLARSYLKLDNIPEAVKILDLITRKYSKSKEAATAYYLKGWLAQQKGDFESANKEYLALLKKSPDSTLREEAHWQIANNHYNRGKFKKALKYFNEFSKAFPDSHRESEEMTRKCLAGLGDFKVALESSTLFYDMNPDRAVDLKKRYEEAMALFDVESYKDATKVADDIIGKSPSHTLAVKVMVMAGESALRMGMSDKASNYFSMARKHLKRGPLRNLVSFRLGETAFAAKDYRDSLVELEKVEALDKLTDEEIKTVERYIDPAYMMAKNYFLKGEAYFSLNLEEKGFENFERLIDDYPHVKGLDAERLKAGLVFQQHRKYDQAIMVLSHLVASSEESKIKAEAQYWIGECYQYMGNMERAVVEYLKVTYLYPSESMWALTARYMAAQSYQELGHYKEAISLYEKVAKESQDKRKSEYARKRIEELAAKLPADNKSLKE